MLRAFLAFALAMVACSPHPSTAPATPPLYTEADVQVFVRPGVPREAIIKRFGRPLGDEKNPKFEGGSTTVDEIIYYFLPPLNPPRAEHSAFSGFQVGLKDGKTVDWSASRRDVQVSP